MTIYLLALEKVEYVNKNFKESFSNQSFREKERVGGANPSFPTIGAWYTCMEETLETQCIVLVITSCVFDGEVAQ